MKKKFIALFLVLALIVGLGSGCNQPSNEGESENDSNDIIQIGFAVNDFNDKWVTYMIEAVKEWDEEHPEVEVTIGNGESDAQTQMAIVESWINQGYDAVCVKPVDLEATKSLALQAEEAGVYYIAIQQGIDEATAGALQDSIQAGNDQMQAVVDLLGGKGKIGLMTGELGTLVATDRIKGNKDVLEKNPDVELVVEETGNWQRDQGMKIMENWIQAGVELDGVVASNDEMAIGAILALEEAGLLDRCVVAGFDCTPDGIAYLEDGSMNLSLFADAALIGRESLDLAMKVIKEGSADDVIIQDIVVFPEEASKYK